MKESKQLKSLLRRYEKVVEKIEQLNDEAFQLEQAIVFERTQAGE